MTCGQARALFSALVDDELSARERVEADTHLAGCAECRRELDRFSRTVSMVRALPPERAPVGFVDRVMEAAQPVPWPRRLLRRLFVPLGVKIPAQVAAVIMVATTAVWVFQSTPELQQAARQEAPAPAPVPPAVAPSAPTPAPTSPRPKAAPPPAVASRDAASERPASLKDDAGSSVAQPAPEAKDEAGRKDIIAPREMESRRTERDATVGGAGAAGTVAPAPARESVAKQAAPRVAARVREADVAVTWRVADRDAAARELDALVLRLGGGPITRRTEGDVETAEFSLPREAYDELARVLARLGTLTGGPATDPLPSSVRVSLRISS